MSKTDMKTYLIGNKKISKSSNNDKIQEAREKFKGGKVVEPPFSFDLLVKVFETNFIANKSSDIFAKKVAYSGFDIVKDDSDEENEDDKLKDKIKKAQDFFRNINPDTTFEDLVYSAAIDYKITGNCAIEVARGFDGEVKNLYNIPISSVRVLKGDKTFRTGQRYVQVYDDKYDEYIIYNKYYPKPDDRNADNGFADDLNKDIDTHEMIFLKSANPGNMWYGYSPSFTVTRSYLIKKYIDDSHIQEFENSFLNRFAIVIEEGTITDKSILALQEYLAGIKEDQDWTAIPVIHNPTGRVRIEKLGESIRDGSYLDLLDKINQEIIVTFGVPPILLGINENSTQANQDAQEKKFYFEEVLPFQNLLCKLFTRMIQEDFGLSGIKIIPKIPDFTNRGTEIDVVLKGIEKGIFSINRGRAIMGEVPLLGKDGEELEGASKSYIYIGGKPVPVEDLIKFTGDTATQIDLESLLAQVNDTGKKLAKGKAISEENNKNSIKYDEI